MNIVETIKVALEGIWLNRVRSLLTVLGIIMGTATIILVVAVGKGGEQAVSDEFSRLSPTTIYIMSSGGSSGQSRDGGSRQGGGGAGSSGNARISRLSVEDVYAIKEKSNLVSAASPLIQDKAYVGFDAFQSEITILGVNSDYRYLTNMVFQSGGFFAQEEYMGMQKVIVMGADIAEEFFGEEGSWYIYQDILINRHRFQVVGILERKGEETIDQGIFMPFTTAQRYVLGTQTNLQIIAQAVSIDEVPAAIEEITIILRDEHRLSLDQENDFRIRDAGSRLISAQESAKTMSVLLLAVAAIVLLVGGIGIMNVMLVSVRERTREIGTRRAIGARKKDVLRQFMFEAIGLSILGGLIGLFTGELMLPLMKYFEVDTMRTVEGMIIALLFSVAVGVFFGYYPALKAAGLNPIEALRYE